jgi:PTS system fructose-specific IIC component
LLGADKPAVITELVELLGQSGRLTDTPAVLEAVLAREKVRSTAVGGGLAVPHAKSQGCPQLALAVGRPSVPIDFDSQDGRPCRLIVLLASPPDATGLHIQALAGISRLWLNPAFREAALLAATSAELHAAFARFQT